jgi:hypothetical protein
MEQLEQLHGVHVFGRLEVLWVLGLADCWKLGTGQQWLLGREGRVFVWFVALGCDRSGERGDVMRRQGEALMLAL